MTQLFPRPVSLRSACLHRFCPSSRLQPPATSSGPPEDPLQLSQRTRGFYEQAGAEEEQQPMVEPGGVATTTLR